MRLVSNSEVELSQVYTNAFVFEKKLRENDICALFGKKNDVFSEKGSL